MYQSLNLQSDYHFILNCFNPKEIDLLISDMELHSQGYEFLYVIDTYDIMENYLPYYQIELFSKNDKNYQAQKFICYDYFFCDLNTTNCILLNEYKIELFSVKNKLNKSLRDARAVIQNLEDLKKGTSDFFEDKEKAATFFKKNLDVILLLLILSDKSESILREFFSFMKKRLNISEVQVRRQIDKHVVEQIFNSSVCTQFSINLFERYINENKRYLLTIQNPDEREIFMKKTFRDIQAIERVMETNRRFTKKKIKYKTIYLSSAKKTTEIFKSIKSLPEIERRKNYSENISRNIYQFFLFDRLQHEFVNDSENAISLLKDLKTLLLKLSESSKLHENALNEQFDYTTIKRVKRFFDDKSDILDNHFFYSIFEKYKNTFSHLNSDNLHSLDKMELYRILEEVERNKSTYKSRIFALEFSLSQLNQTYDVVEAFWGAKDYEPEYRYGQDIIRNPYQHLPILLLIGEQFNSHLKDKLYLFLNINVEIQNNDHAILKECVREILIELDKLQTKSQYTKSLKSLIITYLNFVAQTKHKPLNGVSENFHKELEEKLIFDLEKQYSMIKHQFSKIDYEQITKGENLEFITEPIDLLKEIVYVLLWLYRRTLNEDQGLQKAIGLINTNFDDPRIYQGIGLCYVSKVYKILKFGKGSVQDEIRTNADLAIQYLKTAQKNYKFLINTASKTDNSFLIIKNFIAVLNSLADMHVRKYENLIGKKDYSLIETARECIVEIKSLFNTIQLIYNEHATYSATEIEIEYYEALHYFENSMLSTAHEKIINASTRFNMLKKLSVGDKLIDRLFLDKQKDISQLTYKIINYNSKKNQHE